MTKYVIMDTSKYLSKSRVTGKLVTVPVPDLSNLVFASYEMAQNYLYNDPSLILYNNSLETPLRIVPVDWSNDNGQ